MGSRFKERDMPAESAADFAAEAQRQMHEYQACWPITHTSSRSSGGYVARSGYDDATEFVFGLDLILDSLDKLRDA
jgi:hypothetical protein